jgi:hypothetical protein
MAANWPYPLTGRAWPPFSGSGLITSAGLFAAQELVIARHQQQMNMDCERGEV